MGLSGTACVLLGFSFWLLWGFLFAVNYITYIGSIVGLRAAGRPGLPRPGQPRRGHGPGCPGRLNRFVWIDYIEVTMAGRHLNIDSILLFLWLAYWGWVWGVHRADPGLPMIDQPENRPGAPGEHQGLGRADER